MIWPEEEEVAQLESAALAVLLLAKGGDQCSHQPVQVTVAGHHRTTAA